MKCMICLIAACAVLLSGCSGQDAGDKKQDAGTAMVKEQSQATEDAAISIGEAKKAALDNAGLSEKDGTWKKEKVEKDNGRIVYDLEFVSGKTEYDFEFDAKTGDILEYDKGSIYD